MCPGEDRYQRLPETSPPDFSSHVLHFLWRLVKHLDLCCCVSMFYCSTSTDLENCKQGCCGKCEEKKLSGLNSELSGTETDEITETEEKRTLIVKQSLRKCLRMRRRGKVKVKPMMETGGMINDHLNYDEYSIDCINTYLTKNVFGNLIIKLLCHHLI